MPAFLKVIFAGLTIASLSACSSTWETGNVGRSESAATLESRPASEIQITSGNLSGQPYAILKDLAVTVNKTTAFSADPTVQDVEAKLKSEAAELGADAVINAKVTEVRVSLLSWGTRKGTGTAVKFQK